MWPAACICASALQLRIEADNAQVLRDPRRFQVTAPPEAKEDARVNCGNALAAWAQLEQPEQALQLLRLALRAYSSAVDSAEDTSVSGGLADFCSSLAGLWYPSAVLCRLC